jgi:hypothetical protein
MMGERTKIREMWVCVGDDGSGTGEGVLSMIRALPPELASFTGLRVGTATSVLMVAYDYETAKRVVAKAREMKKPFRVIHFENPDDVTAHF